MTGLDSLVRNQWEFYDVKRMRKLKAALIGPLLVIIWILFVFLVWLVASFIGYTDFTVILILGTVITVIVMLVVLVNLKKMDKDKKDWYFSAHQDKRLNREWLLAMLSDFIRRNGYMFTEATTNRSMTLWITYFDIAGADFKVRLWFSTIAGTPVAEFGIGPETIINRKRIEELRTKMSAEMAAAFPMAGTGPLVAPVPPAFENRPQS